MGMFDVAGKRVLITGASRGIGYSVAKAFAEAGAEVAILASGEAVGASAAALERATGRKVRGVRCDISNRNEVYDKVGALGSLDVLINNAAICVQTPTAGSRDEVDEIFERTMAINLSGQFYVTRAVAPNMGSGGSIVFTGSVWSKAAGADYAAYCASKHGLIGMMRALAHELGPRGITVNAVCPGTTRTEMNETGITPEVRKAYFAQMVVHRGWIEPDDMAGVFMFFASPAAKDITGQAIGYDRGQVMF